MIIISGSCKNLSAAVLPDIHYLKFNHMTPTTALKIVKRKSYSQKKCISLFLAMAIPVLFGISRLEKINYVLFHILLFTSGWLSWTFVEYIAHRFWMHGKGNALYYMASRKHLHHHQHPEDRKVRPVHRALMLALIIFFIYVSILLKNYFTLFAGFYTGFAGFCLIHYVLHKTWSQQIFKELIEYHIYHHCKYPDYCHGVTVTWWDKIFATKPPQQAHISARIRHFYFEGHNAS